MSFSENDTGNSLTTKTPNKSAFAGSVFFEEIRQTEKIYKAVYIITDHLEDETIKTTLRLKMTKLLTSFYSAVSSGSPSIPVSLFALIDTVRSLLLLSGELGFISEMNSIMVDRALDDLNKKIEAKKFIFSLKDGQTVTSVEGLPKDFFNEELREERTGGQVEVLKRREVSVNDTTKRQFKNNMSFKPETSDREKDVVLFIKERGRVSGVDLSLNFTTLTQKTLQRTLAKLIESGQIKKDGDKRWATYSVNDIL